MTRISFLIAGFFMNTAMASAGQAWTINETAFGRVYADDKGMALYVFDMDPPGKSICNNACGAYWTPFKAADDATPDGEWTIVVRADGSRMWALRGRPLYTYVNDTVPGDVTGDGRGDTWRVAKLPAGEVDALR